MNDKLLEAGNTPKCPDCGLPMVVKMNRHHTTDSRFLGRPTGGKFWGCSDYPNCKGVINIKSTPCPIRCTRAGNPITGDEDAK